MRLYEVVYILDPALEEGAVTAKLEKFHALATSSGGEVSAVDHWGIRQLAYPIKRHKSGYYVVAQFTAAPDALPEFERLLKLDEEVMRYLLVLNEGEPTSGMSIMAEVTRPAGDKDEDEDEEEEEDEDDDSRPSSRGGAAAVVAWKGLRSSS
jgi:small subunit ribosomal protein S6